MFQRITLLFLACLCPCAARAETGTWEAVLRNSAGSPLAGAVVELRPQTGTVFAVATNTNGVFTFRGLGPGSYEVSVRLEKKEARAEMPIEIRGEEHLNTWLELTDELKILVHSVLEKPAAQASGGERLSSREVSGLPLNKRDFSQLLLLASGTMTDTNGAANFTQQFAVNGQRGTTAVFAMDGIDMTDPEMGGATFSNFNVDAIQEIRSNSGVMPAEIGHGAAGFTEVVTKSGSAQMHGSLFEFVRNAAFDARNFFDRRSIANPGRIPPFARNEFGITNGGPVILPRIYDGRDRTFYFVQYQGFRQVLGTTQVFPVPTLDERAGKDSTAFAGDTLFVPVSEAVKPVLARYPLPNDPQGPYGARTFATSSKVSTVSDQFSVRLDHTVSHKAHVFSRFNLNNVTGPTTNPSQTAIDPSFATRFVDNQRNFGLGYTRTVSPNLVLESAAGFLRSTPLFPPLNHIQPAMKFGDGLYEPFNASAGTITGTFGNLIQLRQSISLSRGKHSLKMGVETQFNRDSAIFGLSPNGEYTFGGGAAYAPAEIRSLSGLHDIPAGDPLPDSLTGFLTATPFAYKVSVAPPLFPQGDRLGLSAVSRDSYNFYFQDTWKFGSQWVVNYGLRYEVNSRMRERKRLSSNALLAGQDPYSGARQKFVVNPDPPYDMDWSGWGPRLSIEKGFGDHTLLRAGGAITTMLPNLFQTDLITGGTPFVFYPSLTASPGWPVPFSNTTVRLALPPILTPTGQPVFATGRSTDVPPNTEIDLQRFEEDLAALTHTTQISALTVFGMARNFRNGYIGTYTAGLEHDFHDVKFSASYVATAGVKLPAAFFPNGYIGAEPRFAPFTRFDPSGRVTGGLGPEFIIYSRSHSTYHSLQTALQKSSARAGLGFQASYTYGKALDDTSAVLGGFYGANQGTLQQTFPQNPNNPRADKGPSTFDVTHVVVFSLVQVLPFERLGLSNGFGRALASGWQLLNISTLTSGSPFSIYSGVQQTGVGSSDADRPDQVGQPVLSTSRKVREDYFGQGAANPAFFSIPIGVPEGTGPNRGRFGALGRNTFRGPGMHNFDVALIKDTELGHRDANSMVTVQFRAEVFNFLNLVNFGLPANIVRGPGFGLINHTVAPSRQIQFSLKLIY